VHPNFACDKYAAESPCLQIDGTRSFIKAVKGDTTKIINIFIKFHNKQKKLETEECSTRTSYRLLTVKPIHCFLVQIVLFPSSVPVVKNSPGSTAFEIAVSS